MLTTTEPVFKYIAVFLLMSISVGAEAEKPSASALDTAVSHATAQGFEGIDPASVAQLRAFGQPGLDALIRASMIHAGSERLPADRFGNTSYHAFNWDLVDAVAAQRDAHVSGLFWYTDLDAAITEAQRSGRPILSLRLLGRLDTDLSCANSRFFRSVLYADTRISQKLRDEFVLHWQTVRPVPVITIDMGDGRTIKRTITGNSAHYVLDSRGRVTDVLPGLYAPRTFERLLDVAGMKACELAGSDEDARATALTEWHLQRVLALELELVGWGIAPAPATRDADLLLELTRSKSVLETPLVRQVVRDETLLLDAAQWQQIAARYADESRLDLGSQKLMRSKMPAEAANDLTVGKRIVETPFMRTVRNLQQSIALDTARNEHDLHRRIHAWFAAGENLDNLVVLNTRVYDELFLMSDDDPWLGLVPADTYSALDGGGLSE